MPSLAPGQTNRVTLLLMPAVGLPLGPYTGSLAVNAATAGLSVPFNFRAVSDARGDLLLDAVDEFTYYAEGAPHLAGATVTVRDSVTQTNVAVGMTDTNGYFTVTQLNEGYYDIEVTAEKHTTSRGTRRVRAGIVNEVPAFLSRQTVTYTWTVEPVAFEDRYNVIVETSFEANVPAPVVTVEPAFFDAGSLTESGQSIETEIKVTNHGLIAAQNLEFNLGAHPWYEIALPTLALGSLPANSSVRIPVTIRRTGGPAPGIAAGKSASVAKSSVPCHLELGLGWFYPCGIEDVSTGIAFPVLNVAGDCENQRRRPEPPPPPPIIVGCQNCRRIIDPILPITPTHPQEGQTSCDQCMATAIINCGIGFIPVVGCAYAVAQCLAQVHSNPDPRSSAENCALAAVGCTGPLGNAGACAASFLRCKCPGYDLDSVSACFAGTLDPAMRYAGLVVPQIRLIKTIVGGSSTANVRAALDGASVFNESGGPWIESLGDAAFTPFWNVFAEQVAVGSSSGSLIDIVEELIAIAEDILQARSAAQMLGFQDLAEPFHALVEQRRLSQDTGGVCARVRVRLEQQSAITRDGFRATLEIDNQGPSRLENIRVAVNLDSEVGVAASELFSVRLESATTISSVDGTGILPGNSTGTAKWLIIPTVDAAPIVATTYLVGGTLSYRIDGNDVAVPLAEVPITVLPSPRLTLQYFHQRDVFSDAPFTPQIEPAILYSLAVMLQNRGFGEAKNFRITSAQPRIVDNEKGLLINFNIIASEVNGQPVSPSLTVNFGNIGAGSNAIGRWLFTSSLQGLFTDYRATFEHIDGLGNPRLSLIDDVSITR